MQALSEKSGQDNKQADFLPLNGTDYIEFYVGNAKQAAYFYRAALGIGRLPIHDRPMNSHESASGQWFHENSVERALTSP